MTIEERAITSTVNLHLNPETYNEDKAKVYKQGYIHGATDQHKIDIEKALSFIIDAIEYTDGIMSFKYNDEEAIEETFRKAMEK